MFLLPTVTCPMKCIDNKNNDLDPKSVSTVSYSFKNWSSYPKYIILVQNFHCSEWN